MTALGFIETKGLLAAINAADAMLKAADVRLVGKNLASGGLVAITVAGEVSAVRASVDAGVAAVRQIEGATLLSEHVIARPDVELGNIIAVKAPVSPTPSPGTPPSTPSSPLPGAPQGGQGPVSGAAPEGTPVKEAKESADAVQSGATAAPAAAQAKAPGTPATVGLVRHDLAQLRKMSVSRLRQIARSLSGIALAPEKIASADRKVLLEKIVNAYRQIEE